MYTQMELVGLKNVLYFDTDSVYYLEKGSEGEPNTYRPVIGDRLGMWSDEIRSKFGPTAYIQSFVCTGPKAYAYIVKYTDDADKQDEIVKFKGYRFTSNNTLTFNKLKSMVLGSADACDSNQFRIISPLDITRDSHFSVRSRPTVKTFQFTFNKRVCTAEHQFTRQTPQPCLEANDNNNNNICIETKPFGYRA